MKAYGKIIPFVKFEISVAESWSTTDKGMWVAQNEWKSFSEKVEQTGCDDAYGRMESLCTYTGTRTVHDENGFLSPGDWRGNCRVRVGRRNDVRNAVGRRTTGAQGGPPAARL